MTQTNDNFSGRRRTGKLGILLLLTSAILFMGGQALRPWPAAGLLPETQILWERHRERILAPGGLVHHFAFLRDESLASMGQDEMSFWKSLTLLADASVQNFKFVSGRWPGKYAIQMDRSPLELAPPQFEKSFTVQLWFRHHRPGLNPGPNSDIDATILALGDGVWSGLKFWIRYPQNVLMFDVGQPKPAHAVSLAAINRVCPETWHHAAATWDGATVSLYVDGLLNDRVAWDGAFHNPHRSSRLRLGFTGNGLGSAIIDFDEVAVFESCLSDEQIFECALSGAPIEEPQVDLLANAIRNSWQSPERGVVELEEIGTNRGNSPAIRGSALLRIHDVHRLKHETSSLDLLNSVREIAEKNLSNDVFMQSLSRSALHEAICVKVSDKIAESYFPEKRDHAFAEFDPNSIVRLCPEYDEAVEAFRRELARGDLEEWKRNFDSTHLAFLQQSCQRCHNSNNASGGLDVERLHDGNAATLALEEMERIVSVLQDGTMPPKGNPMPATRVVRSFVTWFESRPQFALCEEIATDDTQRWYEGYIHSRRLTRLEYRNAIRDLLGVQLAESDLPPQDGFGGEGFDNVGDTLFTSTSQIEDYLHSTTVALQLARQQETKVLDDSLSEQSLKKFCRRAWRRPVAHEEILRLSELHQKGESAGLSKEQCSTLVHQSILMSPHFLFVVEPAPETQGVYRLSAHELAMRLALFLWSSIPDEELLELAESGELLRSEVISQQAVRMLKDRRATAMGEAFGLQWLGLLDHDRTPDAKIFPEFDAGLAHDMNEEVVRSISRVFSENRSVLDLLDSDWIIINRRLAEHYGLSERPVDWAEVKLSSRERGGVLTSGAVLTKTSYSHRTSPVLRGQWVINQLLGRTVPPPPPNVPSLDASESTGAATTMRMRLEQHRKDPACAGCHQQMDPLGFTLENYDAIGRWRNVENGVSVDSSALLSDGTALNGPIELKRMLNERRDEFLRNFVRRLLGFALGRSLNSFDDCVVDRCLELLKSNDYHSHVLVQEICLSRPFQYRFTPRESSSIKAASLAGDRP